MHDFIKFRVLKDYETESFKNLFFSAFYATLKKLRTFKRLVHSSKKKLLNQKMLAVFNSSKFMVAYDKDNENLIYAFLAFTQDNKYFYLNFAYVKRDFRGLGIFKHMFDMVYEDGKNKYFILPYGELKKYSFFKGFKYLKGAL